MPTGKLDYAYRLSAARLVILRMRLSRFIHKHFQLEGSNSGSIKVSRSTVLLSLFGVVLSFGVAVWVGREWSHDTTVDSHKLIESRSNLVSDKEPLVKMDSDQTTLRASHVKHRVQNAQEENKDLSFKVRELENSLIIREKENAVIKDLLGKRAAEIASLRRQTNALDFQLKRAEQEKVELEQELQTQEELYVNAKAHWVAANTERKVVYNITNIPVGGFVSEDQIQSDGQASNDRVSVEEALSVESSGDSIEPGEDSQGYTYPFGSDTSDVNSTDPDQESRDTSNDIGETDWKGDDYLPDDPDSRLEETDPILLDPDSLVETNKMRRRK